MTSIIAAAAQFAGISPTLLLAICYVESGHRNVTSHVDGSSASYGVCQVKLATARMFNKSVYPSTLIRPEGSAHYAALYVAHLLRRYDGDSRRAIAAYNSGSARACGEFLCNESYVRAVKRARSRFDISDNNAQTH